MPATPFPTESHDPPRRRAGADLRGAGDATAEAAGARSRAMSAGLARDWWAVGLRGIAAVLFGLGILALPSPTIASLVLLFTAYVTADGVFAILAGVRAANRIERWWTLIVEGVDAPWLTGLWLVGYALLFGATLLLLAFRLKRRHSESG
jgi:uncharacterized membrane protein HdeD (DUF308 family)